MSSVRQFNPVDYFDSLAKHVRDWREDRKNWEKTTNVASLTITNIAGKTKTFISEGRGNFQHSERLVLAAGIAFLTMRNENDINFDSNTLKEFKNLPQRSATLYTEREPCKYTSGNADNCQKLVNECLSNTTDKVFYTIPYNNSDTMSDLLKPYLEEAKARVHFENELKILEEITPPSSQDLPSYLINNEIINQSNNNTTIDTATQSNINITAANTVEAMADAQQPAENIIQSIVNISETTSSTVQSNATTTQQETENPTPSDEKFSDNPSTISQLNEDSPEIKAKRVKLSYAQEAEQQADSINQGDEKSSEHCYTK